jgi:uncharacterized protein
MGADGASAGRKPAGGTPAGASKGPRPKHVPKRMCIACRSHDAKRGLHRIVRTPEGPVELDPGGKRNGRGAYLCGAPACWERALSTGLLARALKTEIQPHTIAALRHFAQSLPERAADETEVRTNG